MCVFALISGCSNDAGMTEVGGTGGTSTDQSPYADKDLWLCRPDIENDHCDVADLSMTEIQSDGTMVLLDEVAPNPEAEVDCFYVYHTVDYSPEPGNTENLVPPPEEVVATVFRNGAHYRGLCRMFAPLYRQMTFNTYVRYRWAWEDTEFFRKAYGDVVDAFEYYIRAHNNGRGFVLIGHSQGSHILARLLEDRFDEDEALRSQLVSAVFIGPTNFVQVQEGELTGGSFANISLCTRAEETGCVIAFDANPTDIATTPDVSVLATRPASRACVNPATFDQSQGTLAALQYPRRYTSLIPFPDGVLTEWVRYPSIFASQCAGGGGNLNMLEVDLATDYAGNVPITPQQLQQALVEVWGSTRNLHAAEYFIANADLVRIVGQQITAWTDE